MSCNDLSKPEVIGTIIAGDSRKIQVKCVTEKGLPIDLTTASDVLFSLNQYGYNTPPLIQKTLSSGISIDGTDNEIAVVLLDSVDTQGFNFGKYYFVLTVEDFGTPTNSGSIEGLIIIKQNTNY